VEAEAIQETVVVEEVKQKSKKSLFKKGKSQKTISLSKHLILAKKRCTIS